MSDAIANNGDRGALRLLAWLRRGLATGITGAEGSVATVPVSVRAGQHGDRATVEQTLVLRGPGDVIGVDAVEFVRSEPAADSEASEPNYLPFVELASPDLPWRHTPLAADEKLRPWLVLICVEQRDGVTLRSDPALPLPQLELGGDRPAGEELPDLDESWAWAHVQCSLDFGDEAELAALLDTRPDAFVARLLCPRRLQAGARYLAAVVPAFAAGVAAGQGRAVDDGDPLEPAWTGTETSISLPVYHHWSFHTGEQGDFESLVRRLEPMVAPPDLGTHPLDLGDAGPGLPPGADASYRGALVSPAAEPPRWRDEAFREALVARLQPVEDLDGTGPDEPVVGPPLVGSRETGVTRCGAPDAPRWLTTLNERPGWRSAAGLGAAVVRRHAEAWMADAWDQARDAREATIAVHRAALAAAVGRTLQTRLDALPDEERVQLAVRALPRLKAASGGAATALAELERSETPRQLVSPTFRRITRPGTAVGRLASTADGGALPCAAITGRLLDGALAVDRLLAIPSVPVSSLIDDEVDDAAARSTDEAAPGLARPARDDAPAPRRRRRRGGGRARSTRRRVESTPTVPRITPAAAADPRTPEGIPSATLPSLPDRLSTLPGERVTDLEALPYTLGDATLERSTRTSAERGLAQTARSVALGLDPVPAVAARLAARVGGVAGLTAARVPSTVRFAPTFDRPTWVELAALDVELWMPGYGSLPRERATLLAVEARTIEAFLAGMNDEMARELSWREYPFCDGATFFRRFWDAVPTPAQPEPSPDVPPIADWTGALGGQLDPTRGDALVVLVRGELIRRYPDVICYAVAARWNDARTRRVPDDATSVDPLFDGMLGRDALFVGLDLDEDDARGDADEAADRPGWFLVFEQQPTGPRFGLDEDRADGDDGASWANVSWAEVIDEGHLAVDGTHLAVAGGLDGERREAAAGPSRDTWGADAAHMARITWQPPVRLFVHASRLLGGGDDA